MDILKIKTLTEEEIQKEYYNYLLHNATKRNGGHYSINTANKYAYDGPKNNNLKNIVKAVSGKQSIFEIYDIDILNEIKEKIKAEQFDINGNKMYSNSVSSYIDFINYEPSQYNITQIPKTMKQYITAIQTKPFILLAGISGTGKSRIVRQLARACDNVDADPWEIQKPANFEMIQVKPNWHDSSELLGYVSRINGEKYIIGDFIKFIAEAWKNPTTPFFLCLDEMNLAPVEQYFAEYLSVIESRRLNSDNTITTDPIIKPSNDEWYSVLIEELSSDSPEVNREFTEHGITIPQNLVVMGTVNMDETTFSFSRKVLDRAMTIEMNDVNMNVGLSKDDSDENFQIAFNDIIGRYAEGKDVYDDNKDLCDVVIKYLNAINEQLEGTPFKIAYRTRNEFLMYAVNRGNQFINNTIDEMTSMKILSRIEGDEDKIKTLNGSSILDEIERILKEYLKDYDSISVAKISEMKKRLSNTGYTSYWS